ncbi:hypothetical protein [Nisaea sediminum]|uniref:hypothetical protein n=2 Tax=Pseudomonadota TaxID=1224 RepID=UPI0018661B9D|nr:hypothetical protein [Nisaea sediminum]
MNRSTLQNIVGILIATNLATGLLWLFSEQQIATVGTIAEKYGAMIGAVIGAIGAFGAAVYTLHGERRQRRVRIATGIAERVRAMHSEITGKIDWFLVDVTLSTGVVGPPYYMSDVKTAFTDIPPVEKDAVAKVYNEIFIDERISARLDDFLRDMEELSPQAFALLISVQNRLTEIEAEKLHFPHTPRGFKVSGSNLVLRLRRLLLVVRMCEQLVDLLREEYGVSNSRLTPFNEIEDDIELPSF